MCLTLSISLSRTKQARDALRRKTFYAEDETSSRSIQRAEENFQASKYNLNFNNSEPPKLQRRKSSMASLFPHLVNDKGEKERGSLKIDYALAVYDFTCNFFQSGQN